MQDSTSAGTMEFIWLSDGLSVKHREQGVWINGIYQKSKYKGIEQKSVGFDAGYDFNGRYFSNSAFFTGLSM